MGLSSHQHGLCNHLSMMPDKDVIGNGISQTSCKHPFGCLDGVMGHLQIIEGLQKGVCHILLFPAWPGSMSSPPLTVPVNVSNHCQDQTADLSCCSQSSSRQATGPWKVLSSNSRRARSTYLWLCIRSLQGSAKSWLSTLKASCDISWASPR